MSLRGELLAAAEAQRDRVLDDLRDNLDLRFVAEFEWGRIVGKLAGGGVYRISRDELPDGHPERWRGKATDVLTLAGDDEFCAVA